MNKKSSNVELMRFLAILAIMATHLFHAGISSYPFIDGWIYVEFFLLITGFYTARHFDGKSETNKPKEAVVYTIRKFKPLLPYAVGVSILAYVTNAIIGVLLEGWTWKSAIKSFLGDFIFDVLLVSDSYTKPLVEPLWFLSAMLIVFPLFLLLVQIENRYLKIIIISFAAIMYYGWQGVTGNRAFPIDFLRVTCGMLVGVLLYEFSVVLKQYIVKMSRLLLTVIEIICLAFPIASCYFNRGTFRLDLLCFFVSLLIALPGFSYTGNLHGKWMNYLGRLSMPMFIFHWYVGTLVEVFGRLYEWGDVTRAVVYYLSTLVLSILAMGIVDCVKKRKESKKA